MNPILSILFLVSSWICCFSLNGFVQSTPIFGGYYDSIEKIPYIAQLLDKGKQFCGATIISETWLLTAAHCLTHENLLDLTVSIASEERELGGFIYEIFQFIIHKDFKPQTLHNDIALIELSKPLTSDIWSAVELKPLLLKDTPPKKDDILLVSGYGKTGHQTEHTKYLKSMKVFVIDNEECKQKYAKRAVKIKDEMFCADSALSDACEGDSGGPAVIDGKLAGIVSFGGNCENYYPGVYTNVYKYFEWIAENTGITDLTEK